MSAYAESELRGLKMQENGELTITPSPSSSYTDFDFLMGNHTVHHKKLSARLVNANDWIEFDGSHTQQPILRGIGNIEQQFMTASDGSAVEGMALRLFDPETKLWSIYWADSIHGKFDPPMVGSFHSKVGYFFAKDIFKDIPILVQFKWDASDITNPIWSQAFSIDNGVTWEWNWYMYFSKTN